MTDIMTTERKTKVLAMLQIQDGGKLTLFSGPLPRPPSAENVYVGNWREEIFGYTNAPDAPAKYAN